MLEYRKAHNQTESKEKARSHSGCLVKSPTPILNHVVKRNGKTEPMHYDKITARIDKLCFGLDKNIVQASRITQEVIGGIFPGIKTAELDDLAAETCIAKLSQHPEFGVLAARITVSNLHKQTTKSFTETVTSLANYIDPKTEKPAGLIDTKVFEFIMRHADRINSTIVYSRDNNFEYFGLQTLLKSYLLKLNNKVVERAQHMIMRVACGLHFDNDDIDAAIESYNLMSEKWFTHASPTLYNCGTPRPQCSSCFLLTMKDDSIEGIYDTLKQCAQISKQAGGIGIATHNIRATGSYIRGTNGISNGLVPMLRVFNNTARYVDQGGGKRKGAFAIYVEPWHADIFGFLDLKKNTGIEENRARDLFYALWIPDLFMERVENDEDWSLFCPNEAPGLAECWGEKFKELYESYESQPSKIRQTIKARKLWVAILEAQTETGVPYMLYKDACNGKSNQQNLGTIRCSNLCTEIVEYTSPTEIAVCNLASIALNMFVKDKTFDFKQLFYITSVVIRNLNKIIDINYYPVPEAGYSNKKHRPIGIGVQGLADAFILMRFPFDSKEAAELNLKIFETIYFAALTTSCELAEKYGHYESYPGSPASKGLLQPDLWNVKLNDDLWNWTQLRVKISVYGIRNSLLVAPMPTASTSQILGNNECFEPYTSNLYVRRTSAGEFACVSKHLMMDLISLGLWNTQMKNKIIAHDGSIQHIPEIPKELRDLYKTVWEIKTKVIIDMAADRGAFICQSQSMNVWMTDVTQESLTSMHFYGWRKGLKTGHMDRRERKRDKLKRSRERRRRDQLKKNYVGMYYLRTRAASDPLKFTLDSSQVAEAQKLQQQTKLENRELKSTPPTTTTVLRRKRSQPDYDQQEEDEEEEESKMTKHKSKR